MFKFYDSKPRVTDLFIGSAVCADSTTIAALQKGGFIYLTNIGKGQTPTANLPDPDNSTGANVLQKFTVYPVFIPRKQDTANNFNPIQSDGLISYIDDTRYTGYVDTDSFSLSGGAIVAGDLLILANTATAEAYDTPGTGGTGGVPKLIKSGSTPKPEEILAVCLVAPNADREMKIKWLA